MTTPEQYDAIIIGAGQAGIPLCTALAEAGRKTAIIERKHLGGTCINEGCTPTKTMVASARVAYLARRAADYGVHTGPVSVNMAEVRRRKQAMVDDFRSGKERRIGSTSNLDLLMGEARFVDHKTLEVRLNDGGTRTLRADLIFINTGTRPARRDYPGLESVPTLDSTSIMELDTIPEHLMIIGGSYIGLEFGQMFRRFGSPVTIVQRSERLMGREDPDVADAVVDIMREDGVDVLLKTNVLRVEKAEGEKIRLRVSVGGEVRAIVGTHLLLATGRTPNTDKLNLEAAGVATDERGFIRVNDRLETNVPGVYALGEVNSEPAFTHISYDDFRIIRDNLIEGKSASTKGRMLPYVMFIDPQLGRIGLSETEARERGLNIKVAKIPMNYVARALEVAETRGFMKAVVDAESEQILGAAILSIEGGEVMAMLQIAMIGKVPYPVLSEAIFAHPTLSESLNTLFGSFVE